MEKIDGGWAVAAGFALTDLSGFEVWVRYLALGGWMDRPHLDSYLRGDELWPAVEHDVVTHVLNEALGDLGIGFAVANAAEVIGAT
jgi:hypothetical protein